MKVGWNFFISKCVRNEFPIMNSYWKVQWMQLSSLPAMRSSLIALCVDFYTLLPFPVIVYWSTNRKWKTKQKFLCFRQKAAEKKTFWNTYIFIWRHSQEQIKFYIKGCQTSMLQFNYSQATVKEYIWFGTPEKASFAQDHYSKLAQGQIESFVVDIRPRAATAAKLNN